MQQVDVDAVRVEAPQRPFGLTHDVVPRSAPVIRPWPDGTHHLGSDHHVIAHRLERPAEDLLRPTGVATVVLETVDVGAVEEGDPAVMCPADQPLGLGTVCLSPQTQSERHRRDLQARCPQPHVFHGSPPVTSGVAHRTRGGSVARRTVPCLGINRTPARSTYPPETAIATRTHAPSCQTSSGTSDQRTFHSPT